MFRKRGASSRGWGAGCLLYLLLLATRLAYADPSQGTASVERLKADVYYFASDTLEGRGITTPGMRLAAEYIRSEFKRIGLKSGTPDGSYYQRFSYRAEGSTSPGIALCNIVGVLEGKGELARETVVIGAHYDHLGHGPNRSLSPEAQQARIYHGADDNASGTAAILELARRFAARGSAPRRRLVFIAFCAEESGEIGSRYYTANPLFPLQDTVTMVNFDMVGRLRNNELGIAGDQSAREFDSILKSMGDRQGIKLLLGGPEVPGNSDHVPFASRDIPILFFCTGTHEERHTPRDTAEKINYEGLSKVVDVAEQVLDSLLALPRPTLSKR